jgi:hypothetical protein
MKFLSKNTALQLLSQMGPISKPKVLENRAKQKSKHKVYQTEINGEIITFPTYTRSEFRSLVKKHIGGRLPFGLKIQKIS